MKHQTRFSKALHAIVIASIVFSSVVQPILAASTIQYPLEDQSPVVNELAQSESVLSEFPPPPNTEIAQTSAAISPDLSSQWLGNNSPATKLRSAMPSHPSLPGRNILLPPRRQAHANNNPLSRLPSFVWEAGANEVTTLDPLSQLHPLARADYEQEATRLAQGDQKEASIGTAVAPDKSQVQDNSSAEVAKASQVTSSLGLSLLATESLTTTIFLPIIAKNSSGGNPSPPPTETITPEEGGVLVSPDGQVTIVFAPGAVEAVAKGYYSDALPRNLPPSLELVGPVFDLAVRQVADNTLINTFPAQAVVAGTIYDPEFDTERTIYDVTPSVNVTIAYKDNNVEDVAEQRLRLYRQDSTTSAWLVIPGTINVQNNLLQATIERTGRYALLSWPTTGAAASINQGEIATTSSHTATQAHVVLDPDHGGGDPNAGQVTYPPEFAASEATYNLQVTQLVRDRLQACGVQVDMTREDDSYVSLPMRADMINSLDPNASATLAFNIVNSFMGDNSVTGSGPEAWVDFNKPGDQAFGGQINSRVSEFTGGLLPNTRGVKDANNWFGGSLYVPTHVTPLYAQAELAFMDNYNDRAVMDDPAGMGSIADGVFMAFLDNLGGPGICEPGFELPDPLSAEERARLRNLGYQNWIRYRGDPVNTSTGNHIQQFTDMDIPGVAGFDFVLQRTYSSLDSREGVFGFGWSSILDMNLRLANDGSVDVRYPDGSGVYFVAEGGGFVPGQDGVFDVLTRTGPDFMLVKPDQMFYLFDSRGELTLIRDRFDNAITFERDGAGQITRIVDSAGRIFDLTYTSSHITSIGDPSGRTINYSYNGNGDLVRVTNGNSGVQQFAYDNHHMTQLTDPEGILYLQNFYDTEGRVIEQIDASGSHDYFDYDLDGQTPFDDNLGNHTQDSYDDLFRVTETVDALSQTESFGYDDDYNVTGYIDKRGHSWSYTYDERGNLLTETNPLGHVTTYTYNPTNDLTSVTDLGGPGGTPRTTSFVYDDQGNLTWIERPDGTIIEATYSAQGQLLTLTDGNGHTTTYGYDSAGNLIKVTDSNGHATEYTYDAVGRMTGVTDANAHTAHFAYDGNDNITQITDSKNRTVSFTYDLNDNLTRMVDRRGGVTTYQYDENLKLIAETDPESHTTTYDYDAMYNRISSTDPAGHITRYRYDAIYQLAEVEHALGGVTHFEYDPNGNVIQVTDSLGQMTNFSYDSLSRLEETTDALDGVTRYEYDAVSRLTREINPRGATTIYEYDLLDRLVVIRDALNGTWQTGYDNAGNIISQADPNGHTVTFSYDPANRLTERIDAGGHPTRFDYDEVGNITRVTDALGRLTRYSHDENDNLTIITDALGHVTRLSYDEEDNLISLTNPNGHITQFSYDLDGLLTTLTEASGPVTTYEYDPAHNLTTLTNAKGNQWTYTYDALNRRVSEIDPLGHTTLFGYDLLSRLTRLADANGIVTRYDYDALDRLAAVVQNEQPGQPGDHQVNVTTTYQYDAVGNLTAITDANGHTTTFRYDLLDRLIQELNPLGNTWQYDYDPVGNLITRTDAKGQVTTYSYDADNLLTTINYPDASDVNFSYDAVHNQTSMSDSLGLTQNKYDALNRLVSSINHLGQEVSYGYDPAGNRTHLTYPDGSVMRYVYDPTNFVERVIDPDGNTFIVTRDATHNITAIQNPNQTVTEYDIDAAERLTEVTNRQNNGSLLSRFAYTLDPIGNRTQTVATYSSGQPAQLTTTYQYDPLYRLIRSADSEDRFTDYAFDAVGNRLQLTTNYDPTLDRQIDVVTTNYSYNAANQLLTTLQEASPRPNNLKRGPQTARALYAFTHEVTAQDGQHIETATAATLLDQANTLITGLEGNPPPNINNVAVALNNLQTEVETARAEGRIDNAGVANSLLTKISRAKQANDQTGGELLTSLYEYDLNGNRIRRTTPVDSTGNANDWEKTDYHYDFENRLVQVQDFRNPGNGNWLPGDETQLTYDGYGRLFRRLHDQHIGGGGQKWVEYVYDGLDPIAEYLDPSPQYVNYYRGLGRILSMRDGPGQGNLAYYHYDGLGSVSMMTKHQGQSAHAYRYSDYGLVLDNNSHAADASNFTDPHNHYTYTSQEWDEYTELLHFYAREYDPAVGVWLQQDSYRGRLDRPATQHRYSYVSSNPISQADLYGYCEVLCAAVIIKGGSMLVDYGWDLWDAGRDIYTIYFNQDASEIDEQVAREDLALIVTLEIAEPDEASINLPGDDIARAAIRKTRKEALEKAARESVEESTEEILERSTKETLEETTDKGANEVHGEIRQELIEETTEQSLKRYRDTWGNINTLADHFSRHGADFGARNADEYAKMANDFFKQADKDGILKKVDESGIIRLYEPKTNTFGSYNPNGTTKTFYKPDPQKHNYPTNMDYWNAQSGN